MGDKKALCVGINLYENYPDSRLNGCVNDAKNMASLLKEFLGFGDADITILTDEQATKANIMNRLQSMVDGAMAGKHNYLVFSMSSHGTQIAEGPEDIKEEPDSYDEAFCPYDLDEVNDMWKRDRIIRDDEFREMFSRLPKNVLLEGFLDTCHSGTGFKFVPRPGQKPRLMVPPKREYELLMKLKAREEERGISMKKAARKRAEPDQTILWAACRAQETSADALIGNTYNGAFTYNFCKAVRDTGCELPRGDIIKHVEKNVSKKYGQVPQLECSKKLKQASLPRVMPIRL